MTEQEYREMMFGAKTATATKGAEVIYNIDDVDYQETTSADREEIQREKQLRVVMLKHVASNLRHHYRLEMWVKPSDVADWIEGGMK